MVESNEATSTPMAVRQALLVPGMHRSGTSALTRVLNILGADLPQRLMRPMPNDNEIGFWESEHLQHIHDRFLEAFSSSWRDVFELPPEAYDSAMATQTLAAILALLEENFHNSACFVIKDPRICRLMQLWTLALKQFHSVPYFIIPVRHPLEVAASLGQRNGFDQSHSLLLWLEHVLLAERATRNYPRVFVNFETLLDDWRSVVHHIEQTLDFQFANPPDTVADEIESFLRPDLRHYQHHHVDLIGSVDVQLQSWVTQAFNWLVQACTDATLAPVVMDAIYTSYAEAGQLFKPIFRSLEERQNQFEHQLWEAESRYKAGQAELFKKKREINHLSHMVDEKNQVLEHVRQQLSLSQEACTATKHQLEQTVDQLNQQQANNQELKQHNQELRQQNQELQHSKQVLEQQQRDLEAQIGNLQQELQQKSEQLTRLTAQFEHKQQQSVALESGLFKRDERLEALLHQTADLEAKCEAEVNECHQQIHQLENELQAIYGSRLWKRAQQLKTWYKVNRYVASSLGIKSLWSLRRQARQWKDYYLIHKSGQFNHSYYLTTYPDVAAANVDPLRHFVEFYQEGRNPNPTFNTQFYLSRYPDIAAAEIHPFVHYLLYGQYEGRETLPRATS